MKKELAKAFRTIQDVSHGVAVERGWWDREVNFGEKIALCHSELSEALDAHRVDPLAKDEKIPAFTKIETELADVILRVADISGGMKLDVAGAIAAKAEYNRIRLDHDAKTRKKKY